MTVGALQRWRIAWLVDGLLEFGESEAFLMTTTLSILQSAHSKP